jgi:hypothetical protein
VTTISWLTVSDVALPRAEKEIIVSLGTRPRSKRRMLALALVPVGVLLAMPAAEAHVGFSLGLGFPPVVVPPPVVAAPPYYPPPPPVAAPPYYYAPTYYYAPPPYYAPGFGFFWYDHFGHRHWHR